MKGQSKLEASERVPLVEACAAREDLVTEEEVGGGSVAGRHPRQQLGEVLLHLGQHLLSVHQVVCVYEVCLEEEDVPLLLCGVSDSVDDGLARSGDSNPDL